MHEGTSNRGPSGDLTCRSPDQGNVFDSRNRTSGSGFARFLNTHTAAQPIDSCYRSSTPTLVRADPCRTAKSFIPDDSASPVVNLTIVSISGPVVRAVLPPAISICPIHVYRIDGDVLRPRLLAPCKTERQQRHPKGEDRCERLWPLGQYEAVLRDLVHRFGDQSTPGSSALRHFPPPRERASLAIRKTAERFPA
jgi:hypothetical protein